jgi:redox-sensitive bicupin YhaK (pirin superfamily)
MITVRCRESLPTTGAPDSPQVRHRGRDDGERFDEVLRLSDDTIAAGTASRQREHRDMEALTYVVEGSYVHVDRDGRRTLAGDGSLLLVTFADGDLHW